jgi:hypothetical protein
MADLKKYLLKDRVEDVAENIIRRLLSYGIGRLLTYRDRFVVGELLKKAKDEDFALQDIIVSICISDTFLKSPQTTEKQ